MSRLIIWKNQKINKMRSDMERLCTRLFEDFGVSPFSRAAVEAPHIDLCETDNDIIVKAEIPGVDPDDLDIIIADDLLTMKGEIKRELTENSENYHRTERRYGFFSRSFKLPCRVKTEDVKASYKKGILNIVMPKCMDRTSRKIEVRAE